MCFALGKAVLREGFFCGDATPQKNASTRGAAKSRHTARLFSPRFCTESWLLRKAFGEISLSLSKNSPRRSLPAAIIPQMGALNQSKFAGCYFDGLPEQPIERVTMKNVTITFDPNAKDCLLYTSRCV